MCWNEQCQEERFPQPHERRSFTDVQKTIPLDIIGALDFECSVAPVNDKDSSEKNTLKQKLEAEFRPVSFCLVFSSKKGKVLYKKYYASDTRCLKQLLKSLDSAERHLAPMMQRYPRHNLPAAEARRLKEEAKECYLCQKPFPFSLEEDLAIQRANASSRSVDADGTLHYGVGGNKEAEGGGQQTKGQLRKKLGQTRVHDHSHFDGHYLGDNDKRAIQ